MMNIDQEKLIEMRKKAQQRLEVLLYLEMQIALGKTNNESISFPNHLDDAILREVIQEVSGIEVYDIFPMPHLSQKLVVF